jgi:hypothetical protein
MGVNKEIEDAFQKCLEGKDEPTKKKRVMPGERREKEDPWRHFAFDVPETEEKQKQEDKIDSKR